MVFGNEYIFIPFSRAVRFTILTFEKILEISDFFPDHISRPHSWNVQGGPETHMIWITVKGRKVTNIPNGSLTQNLNMKKSNYSNYSSKITVLVQCTSPH